MIYKAIKYFCALIVCALFAAIGFVLAIILFPITTIVEIITLVQEIKGDDEFEHGVFAMMVRGYIEWLKECFVKMTSDTKEY